MSWRSDSLAKMSEDDWSSVGATPVDCSSSFVVSRSRRESLRSIRTAISALCRSISSNVVWLIRTSSQSVFARADAVRGTSSRIDISPKKSPFSRVARIFSSPLRFFL